MKGLRIGRRRSRDSEGALSPLELALRPALVEGRWQVPDRFNFTGDVVETLARDPKRRALTSISGEGIIEPRTFLELSEGASVWAVSLREQNVGPNDRVVVMSGTTVDWLEAVLGIWKVGGVVVPCLPTTTASQLERLVSLTDASLVVAERSLEQTIGRMGFSPDVHLFDAGAKRNSKDIPTGVPTHDTASRDLAFVVSTSGAGGSRKDVAHTHGSVFATRVQAEHWLDVGRGDTVWCTADAASPLTIWNTVVGPWSRGAEIALQDGEFDADERLDLLFRLGASILCQSPAEYRALAEHPRLERFRSPRLRRLVSTGDYLDPEVVAVFEERWGMSIADGYGQAETNVIVANLADGAVKPGSLGRALPGHHVAVIDDQGNELPPGVEGDLAVRGRPPTLFAGYWELPEETKSAFLGDWYLTGDVAHVDEEGYFTFVARAEDLISSSGGTFGPYDVERVLEGHPAIASAAVVGIRDLQRGGHFVRAFVVPRRADIASEQHEAELREYVAQTLPASQVPREILFVEELPRLGWKVSRHELRERPLPMRPLWDTPSAEEAEVAAADAPAPFDAEFAPRVVADPAPEPIDMAAIPEIVVPPYEPEVVPDAPVYLPDPQPMTAEAVPVAMPAPEPEPDPTPTVVDAAPVHEHEPEPVVAEALDVEPDPAPQPVTLEAAPVAEPEPEPVVAEAVSVDVEPDPEPVALEAAPVAVPEPVTAPLPPAAEPEPVTAEAAPVEEAELEQPVDLDADPEPTPHVVEPEAPAAEAAPAAELAQEGDTEPTTEPEAQLVVLPEAAEPAPVPHAPAEASPVSPVVGSAEGEQEAEADPPQLSVVEPEELPEYVVEASEAVPPVVVPEPEPEPDLSGPLPEYVVESNGEPAPVVHLEPPLEEEEEEDLGPLPDYVIDPNDPEAPRKQAPPPPPEPKPILAPREKSPAEQEPADSPSLNFPSTASFTLPSARAGTSEPREARAPRPRPQPEPGKAKRPAEPAEPGDEASEVSWMAGLSNRLSAYSLSEEESQAGADDADDESGSAPVD